MSEDLQQIDSLDDDNVRYLCHACCHPNYPQAHYCEKCCVALGDTATIDPIKSIYARGEFFRGIANRKQPEKWIILGTFLIVFQWLIAPSYFLDYLPPKSIYDVLLFAVGCLPAFYALALLYRLAKNILRTHSGQETN